MIQVFYFIDIESYKRLLEYKDEVMEEYNEFKEKNKELVDMMEKLGKIFGDD